MTNPTRTFLADLVIPSGHMIPVVQSSAPSAVTGDILSQTSNDTSEGLWVYNSSANFRRPWNMPWGWVANGVAGTTDQTGISTVVDIFINGSSGTPVQAVWTAVANRIYKVSVSVFCTHTVANAGMNIDVTDTTPTTKWTENLISNGTNPNSGGFISFSYLETGLSAGSVTRKLRARSGSSGMRVFNSGNGPATIIAEDIGPNGAPA